MWFWCFIVGLFLVALVGCLSQDYFWWSMIVTGILWTVGIVIEVFMHLRQEQTVSRMVEEGPPADAPIITAVGESIAAEEVSIK